MQPRTQYVVFESLISMAINTILSVGFVYLVFHSRPFIPADSVRDIVFDMAPQTFMVLLMSSLVPGLLTHRRIASGRFEWHGTVSSSSASRVALRGALLAVTGTVVAVVISWIVLPHLLRSGISFRSLTIAKAFYGMLLAAVATPWAIRRVLD